MIIKKSTVSLAAFVLVVCVAALVGLIVGLTRRGDSSESVLDEDAIVLTATTFSPSVPPTMLPTFKPSVLPSDEPSLRPSIRPSDEPSLRPSLSLLPTISLDPTNTPSILPTTTQSPTTSRFPTILPTVSTRPSAATPVPTSSPSESPSRAPHFLDLVTATEAPMSTLVATEAPTSPPTSEPTSQSRMGTLPYNGANSRFYAIGDVPYSNREAEELEVFIRDLEEDAEFLFHVGDIRSARDERNCTLEEYQEVADILLLSHAPVFIVLGDNEWNDCPNVGEGMNHWLEVFGNFENNWNHTFQVTRSESRPDNFAFVHKRTLFVGLNLVGGLVHDEAEWETRLTAQFQWVQELVTESVLSPAGEADVVVIVGHATPTSKHDDFFDPLADYIRNELQDSIPFLYLNGDAHAWRYDTDFLDRPNIIRMQVEGGTRDPPLQVTVNTGSSELSEIFAYNRMMIDI